MKHKHIKALVPATKVNFGPGRGVERKPRLTMRVEPWTGSDGMWRGLVYLDEVIWCHVSYCATELKARAAAQAYVDELVKHFREGGE